MLRGGGGVYNLPPTLLTYRYDWLIEWLFACLFLDCLKWERKEERKIINFWSINQPIIFHFIIEVKYTKYKVVSSFQYKFFWHIFIYIYIYSYQQVNSIQCYNINLMLLKWVRYWLGGGHSLLKCKSVSVTSDMTAYNIVVNCLLVDYFWPNQKKNVGWVQWSGVEGVEGEFSIWFS